MNNNPLISIAIPTKNRYEYLKSCVEELISLQSKYGNIEIVVQDNTEDNSPIRAFITDNERFINYYHIAESLSVVDNCELAIGHCNGEFICFIGDDDSVAEGIVDVCLWMKENGIESCLGKIVRFNWPDMVFMRHNYKNLSIPHDKKKTGFIDLKKARKQVINRGATDMLELPRVYHGIVSRNAMMRLKEKTGSFFPGPSPDMANGIGLTYILKNHVVINTPVIISGFSYKSTGGQGSRGAHVGKIEEIKHLPKDTLKNWDKYIPRIWTSETIYAESIIKSEQKCSDSKDNIEFNYSAFYGAFAMYHLDLWKFIAPYVNIINVWGIIYHFFRVFSRRSVNYINNLCETKFNVSKQITFDNVQTLKEAGDIVNRHSSEADKSLLHRKIIV